MISSPHSIVAGVVALLLLLKDGDDGALLRLSPAPKTAATSTTTDGAAP